MITRTPTGETSGETSPETVPAAPPQVRPPQALPPQALPRALPPWQRALADGVGSLAELLTLLDLDVAKVCGVDGADLVAGADLAAAAARQFPVRVPRGFVARMRPGDPLDPLLLQVLPTAEETLDVAGWNLEPLKEASFSPIPGLLHKYPGRALLITTGACAVHCRYCFRRHFPYVEHAADWRPALEYLAQDTSVSEVILSGGDPLSLADRKLSQLAADLAAIPHLRRLRVHSRVPIVLPERVDDALLGWLAGTRLQPVMVLHANHPREIDDSVRAACARLCDAGVTLLNQSVLLHRVNDEIDALRDLSEILFAAGVLPYYLHVMDRVAGAAHFDVPDAIAKSLVRELRSSLPGYLVPTLVREQPGALSKTPLGA